MAAEQGSEAGSVILAALATLATVLAVVAATVPLLSAFGNQSERGRQRAAAQAMVDGLAGAAATSVRDSWPRYKADAHPQPCAHGSGPLSHCPSAGSTAELAESAVPSALQSSLTWEVDVYDNAAPYASRWEASADDAELPRWDANEDRRLWVVAKATVGTAAISRASLVTAQSTGAPVGWISEFPFPGPDNVGAYSIDVGPDGNLWFTQGQENAITKMTTSGEVTQYPVPTAKASPREIVAGPDGNLWFTELKAHQVGRITPSGEVTEFPLGPGVRHPTGIASGPDGNLWVLEHTTNSVSRVTTTGEVTTYQVPTAESGAEWIASGPDGNLWFSEMRAGKIGKVTVTGEFTEYPLPGDPPGNPGQITTGPDGNLWFTELGPPGRVGRITPSGQITEFAVPTPEGFNYGIAAGPDGNIWFTEVSAKKIGRITPAGEVTEFPAPGSGGPVALVAGPDGNLWFTQNIGNRIGRMSPGG